MIFFTSDTHAFHKNIIQYSNRPFADEVVMSEALADNINKKVSEGDTLYHLGDWSFGGKDKIPIFREMINCKNIILILGNHDHHIAKTNSEYRKLFKEVHKLYEFSVGKQEITLCHFAMRIWNRSHKGAWHLYGHSHGSLPDDPNSLSFDCGVDCHNYIPLSIDEVSQIISRKTWKSIDHHGEHTN